MKAQPARRRVVLEGRGLIDLAKGKRPTARNAGRARRAALEATVPETETIEDSFRRSMSGFLAQGRDIRDGAASHRALYAAVASGDARDAERQAAANLASSEPDLRVGAPITGNPSA